MTNNKAPSVSNVRIDALVFSLSFETARVPNTSTTVATARLPNGFVVAVGENHTVHPANYDAEQGRQRAIEDATNKARAKLWEHEGYVLARELYAVSQMLDTGIKIGEAHIVTLGVDQSSSRPPHQQRVVDEKLELDDKLTKLTAFIEGNAAFLILSSREKGNLCRQFEAMRLYSSILAERIADFK